MRLLLLCLAVGLLSVEAGGQGGGGRSYLGASAGAGRTVGPRP